MLDIVIMRHHIHKQPYSIICNNYEFIRLPSMNLLTILQKCIPLSKSDWINLELVMEVG